MTKRHFQQMYTEFETLPVSNQKNRINEISPEIKIKYSAESLNYI